jgi:hypothetical protein
LWVEAKLDAPYSGPDQLGKYVAALGGRPAADRALVVLAPARRHADLRGLDGSPLVFALERNTRSDGIGPWFVSWQRVYDAVQSAAARPATPSHVRWLACEFLAFLDEQELKPMRLTEAHVRALGTITEAENAIGQIVEAVTRIVDASWNRTTAGPPRVRKGYVELLYDTGHGATGEQRERAVRLPWKTDTRFGWGIDGAEAFAGITFGDDGPLRRRGYDDWRAQFDDDAWRDEPQAHWLWRIHKLNAVAALPADEQAAHLATFVTATFDELTRSAT